MLQADQVIAQYSDKTELRRIAGRIEGIVRESIYPLANGGWTDLAYRKIARSFALDRLDTLAERTGNAPLREIALNTRATVDSLGDSLDRATVQAEMAHAAGQLFDLASAQ